MESEEDASMWSFLTRSPLFYTALAQIFISIILIISVIYTYKLIKETLSERMTVMNIKIQKLDKRMRMQEPNFDIISNLAKKINISTADMDGERSILMDMLTSQEKLHHTRRDKKKSAKSGRSKRRSIMKKEKKTVKSLVKSLGESPSQHEVKV